MKEFFSKCGIIKEDFETGIFLIKLSSHSFSLCYQLKKKKKKKKKKRFTKDKDLCR